MTRRAIVEGPNTPMVRAIGVALTAAGWNTVSTAAAAIDAVVVCDPAIDFAARVRAFAHERTAPGVCLLAREDADEAPITALARRFAPQVRVLGIAWGPDDRPEDVAAVAAFLVDAQALTAQVVRVDSSRR